MSRAAVPFHSSMISHAWQALGYPSEKVARYWDTRSCGVACLRMVYGRLAPELKMLPAIITEELLRAGAYTEQSGWNHAGLARHGQSNGLDATALELSDIQELLDTAGTSGALIVSIGSSFDEPGSSGHLAVLAGITDSGQIMIHRPSSHHPSEGHSIKVDPGRFWDHFSGRAIHFQAKKLRAGEGHSVIA